MAKAQTDYKALVDKLQSSGPERIYLLYGEEDYLRDSFLGEIIKACRITPSDEFNYKRLSVTSMDLNPVLDALETFPFLSERTLVEVRDFDINKCRDKNADVLKNLDVPDYCTLVIVLGTDYEPDGRLAAIKAIKKLGSVIEFTRQSQGELVKWIGKRFKALGKTIDRVGAEHLVFLTGGVMNRLLPEIEKLASYSQGIAISMDDINTVTIRIPETRVFEMTDKLAAGDFNGAAALLADLLDMREHPIMLLSIIGQQFRQLYAAKIADEYRRGSGFIKEACGIHYDFIVKKLMGAARGFTLSQLSDALELCAEADYAMKSTGLDDTDILKDLLLRVANSK